MRVLLVDPSLFTAPYDAALTRGLIAAGAAPRWWVRPLREGDRPEIPDGYSVAEFYRHTDELPWLPRPLRSAVKGVAHAYGLLRLVRHVARDKPDVIHFQWTVLPLLDGLALLALRRRASVVLTVHDTQAYNGEKISAFQRFAFDWPARLAERVIVHTRAGRDALLRRGIAADKIGVIPHGPLCLAVEGTPPVHRPADDVVRFTLFGEIKPYKGVDVLIEALGQVPAELRRRARVRIAGRPRMDLAPLLARVHALGLERQVELTPRRLNEAEMAELFAQTDCFLFPYRQVDASGVYFLVKSLAPWIIATRVGVFAEDLVDGVQGTLIASEQPRALADAMRTVIAERPRVLRTPPSTAWEEIGRATLALYKTACASRMSQRASVALESGAPVRPRARRDGVEEAAP